jgi:hypothetical protein
LIEYLDGNDRGIIRDGAEGRGENYGRRGHVRRADMSKLSFQ